MDFAEPRVDEIVVFKSLYRQLRRVLTLMVSELRDRLIANGMSAKAPAVQKATDPAIRLLVRR